MAEYFQLKYNIRIPNSDINQPCLVIERGVTTTVLPSSLCNEASLPKDFTKDAQKMRNLQNYKVMNPRDRYQRIYDIIQKIKENPIFKEWDVNLHSEFANVRAKQLNHPEVYNQYNTLSSFDDYE